MVKKSGFEPSVGTEEGKEVRCGIGIRSVVERDLNVSPEYARERRRWKPGTLGQGCTLRSTKEISMFTRKKSSVADELW